MSEWDLPLIGIPKQYFINNTINGFDLSRGGMLDYDGIVGSDDNFYHLFYH